MRHEHLHQRTVVAARHDAAAEAAEGGSGRELDLERAGGRSSAAEETPEGGGSRGDGDDVAAAAIGAEHSEAKRNSLSDCGIVYWY